LFVLPVSLYCFTLAGLVATLTFPAVRAAGSPQRFADLIGQTPTAWPTSAAPEGITVALAEQPG
jgi:hypothetical protein